MARPIKCRRVEFLPSITSFIPVEDDNRGLNAINLKVEELEAMRLKDIEGLNQQECADEMGVSRQTFQNIIDSGRKKVTQALIEGRGINIKGGNYVFTHCQFKCKNCNRTYEVNFIRDRDTCPTCHSHRVVCKNKDARCKELCIK